LINKEKGAEESAKVIFGFYFSGFGRHLSLFSKMITDFQKKVYRIVKKIPKGKTTTYKIIADKLKTSPRAVGQALKRNPYAPAVPCHRVIMSNGKIGGYCGNQQKKNDILSTLKCGVSMM
jgi:O-6-methylguanine DNA methyltransferase